MGQSTAAQQSESSSIVAAPMLHFNGDLNGFVSNHQDAGALSLVNRLCILSKRDSLEKKCSDISRRGYAFYDDYKDDELWLFQTKDQDQAVAIIDAPKGMPLTADLLAFFAQNYDIEPVKILFYEITKFGKDDQELKRKPLEIELNQDAAQSLQDKAGKVVMVFNGLNRVEKKTPQGLTIQAGDDPLARAKINLRAKISYALGLV